MMCCQGEGETFFYMMLSFVLEEEVSIQEDFDGKIDRLLS